MRNKSHGSFMAGSSELHRNPPALTLIVTDSKAVGKHEVTPGGYTIVGRLGGLFGAASQHIAFAGFLRRR